MIAVSCVPSAATLRNTETTVMKGGAVSRNKKRRDTDESSSLLGCEPAAEPTADGPSQSDYRDNPKLGTLWYIVYTLQLTAVLYITKELYALNPKIEVL